MKGALSKQHGFTLIEIVMVIVLLGIIGLITFQVLFSGVETFAITRARKELYDQARLALERMTREIRVANLITVPPLGGSANSITFTKANYTYAAGAPLDGSTTITFRLNGTNLEREGNISTPPVDLAANVTSLLVTYEGITFNSQSNTIGGGNAISWNHAYVAGANKVLIVALGVENNTPGEEVVTSITYGGNSLTAINSASTSPPNPYYSATALWYLLDADFPSPPGSYPIAINFTGALLANRTGAAAVVINGAAQRPPEAQASNNGPGNPISVNLTTQTNGAWILDTVHNGNAGNYTPLNGQTERYDYNPTTATHAGGTLQVAVAGLQAVGWNHNNHIRASMCAAAFAPARIVTLQVALASTQGGTITLRTQVYPRN